MLKSVLTHDFHLICIDNNDKLIQKRLDHVKDLSEVAFVCNIGNYWGLTNISQDKWFDPSTGKMGRAVPGGYMTLGNIEPNRCVFEYSGQYMRANHLKSIDFVGSPPNLWEYFRLMSENELLYLLHIACNRWSNDNANETIRLDTTNSTFDNVRFGSLNIPFEEFLSLSSNETAPLEIVFNIDWKVFRVSLLKPALVFVAFGRGNVFAQLEVSLSSLANPGNYHGDIFLITDIDVNELNAIIPDCYKSRTHIISMCAKDQLDFVGARLAIFDSPALEGYQPILYSDADIVFDRPIEEFLREGAQSRYCSAQIEQFHKNFKESAHNGGTLYEQDPYDIDDVNCFNGGLLLVPNMKNHGRYLAAAYRCLCLYTAQNGRDSIPFYDQSVLNYVLYKMKDFSPDPVTKCTQIGGDGLPVIREMFELNPKNPKGFVHFWNAPAKHLDMKNYLEEVRNSRN